MRNIIIFKFLFSLATVLFFVSCDKDYNEVGDALIGENHFDLASDDASTVASSWKKTGAIASNNLAINALGVLDNSAFGQTTANFVTQVELAIQNPTIGEGVDVQRVTLYIPYFTDKEVTVNTNGTRTYTLDSIYGDQSAKLKLSVYENKNPLNSLNEEPGAPLKDPQLYYTNQDSEFSNIKGNLLNDSSESDQNTEFVFSAAEHDITEDGETTKVYAAPGMRLELNNDFFEDLLLSGKLTSNNVFKDYFKGLYFSVEKAGSNGVLAMMNFKKGVILVEYKEKTSTTDATLVDKSIALNLTGNTVNLLTNDFSSSGITYNSDNAERLYLRGGEGSVATIDLFGTEDLLTYNRTTKKLEAGANNIPDELDQIKANGWLINQATLTFYIDQTAMSTVTEPNRLFLYDMTNKIPILDYYYDGTISSYPNYSKRVFGGIIEKGTDGRGTKYLFRITDYLRDLLNNDKSNVKLGLSVSQSITTSSFKKIQNNILYEDWITLEPTVQNTYYFPEASVMNPLGTILYGSDAADDSKKPKLEIYYTKPN